MRKRRGKRKWGTVREGKKRKRRMNRKKPSDREGGERSEKKRGGRVEEGHRKSQSGWRETMTKTK